MSDPRVHRVQSIEFTAEYHAMKEAEAHQSLRRRVAALLRRIEWSRDGENDRACPSCRGAEYSCGDRHAPDCELAALISECGDA